MTEADEAPLAGIAEQASFLSRPPEPPFRDTAINFTGDEAFVVDGASRPRATRTGSCGSVAACRDFVLRKKIVERHSNRFGFESEPGKA
jgi:hypothetical protein